MTSYYIYINNIKKNSAKCFILSDIEESINFRYFIVFFFIIIGNLVLALLAIILIKIAYLIIFRTWLSTTAQDHPHCSMRSGCSSVPQVCGAFTSSRRSHVRRSMHERTRQVYTAVDHPQWTHRAVLAAREQQDRGLW